MKVMGRFAVNHEAIGLSTSTNNLWYVMCLTGIEQLDSWASSEVSVIKMLITECGFPTLNFNT